MSPVGASYPYQAPIDAYGNGGFRFADMSHRGSILCLPTGIYAWPVISPVSATIEDFRCVLGAGQTVGVLLYGTGLLQAWPAPALKTAFQAAGVAFEAMDTGAAARTYNLLLAERRPVAAALIAVE